MKVELFLSPGCKRCAAARDGLKAVVHQAAPAAVWREVNTVDELDYAVELGVLSLPALAINGTLVFSSLPTPAQLLQAVRQRTGEV